MIAAPADRNLLFGILAVQLDFITRDQLIAAMNAWVLDKSKFLSQILRDQQALSPERQTLLEALVGEHLKQHGNDPEKSLAALSSAESVRRDLQRIDDGDVQMSLAHVGVKSSQSAPANAAGDDDPNTSVTPTVGQATTGGMRFRILRPLAKGGLGEVFIAHDEELHREVALKQIQDRHADDEVSRARFLREAEITGGLEHPGIVPVYGLGTYGEGRPFYAMRFIKGDSLADAIARFHGNVKGRGVAEHFSSVEFRKLLGRFLDVCNAIQYAHDRGVLHRDLKPGNIMLGPYGETLVVDWGLAKAGVKGEAKATASAPSGEKTLYVQGSGSNAETIAGQAIGTPAYMSPEQAAGRLDELGPASDVYSLGATLYCLLTGKASFEKEADLGQLLRKVVGGEFLPPRGREFAVPPALEAICLKAMARESAHRYPTPRALADDLEHWLADEPVSAWPEPWTVKTRRWVGKHRTLVTAAAAVLLVSLVGLVAGLVVVDGLNQELEYVNATLDGSITELRDANTKLDGARKDADVGRREAEKLAKANKMLAAKETKARKEADDRRRHAEKLAQHARFDHLYYRSSEDVAAALLGTGQLLPEVVALEDHELEQSIRLNLGCWLREIHPLRGYFLNRTTIHAVAFSPNGKTILTGSGSDFAAWLWESSTGKPIGVSLKHQNGVRAVAFSPDGKTVLTGSADNTARLWEAATGKPMGAALQHQGAVEAVAFSPDGKTVMTGSIDKTARLWEATTGKPIREPLRHQKGVRAVAFSYDGKTVLTASDDQTARLWEAATGKSIGLPFQHQAEVRCVAFSPNAKTVLTGSSDHTGRLWEAATGKPIGEPLQHEGIVGVVAFSPDSRTVLTGSWDKTARLWEATTGKPIGEPLKHQGMVWAGAFSPDGKAVLTGSWDKTARLWKADTGKPIGAPLQHQHEVHVVAFSPDGKTFLTGSEGKSTARLWDVATDKPTAALLRPQSSVMAVAFSPNGKTVFTGSLDGTARLWEAKTGKANGVSLHHQNEIWALAISPDGKSVVTGSRDMTARLWETATGQPIGAILQHQDIIRAVAFSPNGKTVVTASTDNTARLWDAATGQSIGAAMYHQSAVVAVAFSPDGEMVVTGSADKTARLWDAATGQSIGAVMNHQSAVEAVAFSPDGKTVMTGSRDNTARLWEAATSKPIGVALQHQAPVTSVAFSPDGKTVLTGSHDNTARLWEAATGKSTGVTLQHQSWVGTVCFSPDGKAVLTGSHDNTARLWEAATGKPIGQSLQHQDKVTAVAFSPDGKTVLTGSFDSAARLWQVPQPLRGDAKRILLWIQVSTGLELDEHGVVRFLDAPTWEQRRQRLQELGGPPEM